MKTTKRTTTTITHTFDITEDEIKDLIINHIAATTNIVSEDIGDPEFDIRRDMFRGVTVNCSTVCKDESEEI